MRRNALLPKLMLSVGMTLGCLILLEIAGRWTFPLPRIRWEGAAKSPNQVRILVAGGSTVYGHPVPEFGLAAQLEALLNRASPDKVVEVINLGANGRDSGFALRSIRASMVAQPDAVVVMTGHNEYLERSGEHSKRPALHEAIRELGISRLIHEVVHSIRKRTSGLHAMPERQVPYDRTGPWFEAVKGRYGNHLAAVADLCRREGVPAVFCTLPCNLSDWPPVYRGLVGREPDEAAFIDGLLDQMETNPGAAETGIARLAEGNGDAAIVSYLQGKLEERRNRPAKAQKAYVRARDLDPFPWRASSALNDVVRGMDAPPAAVLVDIERRLIEAARPGPGLYWISDNVHPTPVGNALIAGWLAEVLAARIEGLNPAALGPDTADERWRTYRAGFPKETAKEWDFAWQLETGVYCMKDPYFAFELAEQYLRAAGALAPNQWRVQANLGVLRLFQDRVEDGVALLGRAVALRGAGLHLHDETSTPYLRDAVRRAGVEQALLADGVLSR